MNENLHADLSDLYLSLETLNATNERIAAALEVLARAEKERAARDAWYRASAREWHNGDTCPRYSAIEETPDQFLQRVNF